MEGPPEIVAGMVMKVMTSCSLRPASRARKPPIAWMPSWELPAIRMTASWIRETFGAPPAEVAVAVESLIKLLQLKVLIVTPGSSAGDKFRQAQKDLQRLSLALDE